MARARREHRVTARLSDAEHAELERRAAAHGVPMAEFVRRATLSRSPVAAQSPDDWWDAQSAARREQIMGWLTKNHAPTAPAGLDALPLDLP